MQQIFRRVAFAQITITVHSRLCVYLGSTLANYHITQRLMHHEHAL